MACRFSSRRVFGEIQNGIANAGQAIRQYTDISNTHAQQSIDARPLGGESLTNASLISLSLEFYAETSNLDARNS